MLSQKFLGAVKLPINKIPLPHSILPLSTSALRNKQERPLRPNEVKYDLQKLRAEEKLYGMQIHKDRSFVTDDYVDSQNVRKPFFEMDVDAFKMFHTDFDFSAGSFTKWLRKRTIRSKIRMQKVNTDNIKRLGYDISAAYFAIYHDGKIKFKHIDKWIGPDDINDHDIVPKVFDPNFILTELDLSDIELFYNGLENFQHVGRVKRAIFQRSPLFDEWFADRISHMFPNLEYLDLTDCPMVNERALEAFYKFYDLKTLIVTNYQKSAAFELTCMMLEDIIPGLTIQILPPKEETEESKNKK